jgi:hypothetical protein
MNNRLLDRQQMMQREPDCIASNGLARSFTMIASWAWPDEPMISAARDKVEHLPHPGFSSGTREPQVERWFGNSQQAAKPATSQQSRATLQGDAMRSRGVIVRRRTVSVDPAPTLAMFALKRQAPRQIDLRQ